MISSRNNVEYFLNDVKTAVQNDAVIPINRDKNIRSLATLGITWSDALEEISSLDYEHYIEGPEIDRDQPSSDYLWVFKKRVLGEMIYIKLKILHRCNGELKVLSFHIDET